MFKENLYYAQNVVLVLKIIVFELFRKSVHKLTGVNFYKKFILCTKCEERVRWSEGPVLLRPCFTFMSTSK